MELAEILASCESSRQSGGSETRIPDALRISVLPEEFEII